MWCSALSLLHAGRQALVREHARRARDKSLQRLRCEGRCRCGEPSRALPGGLETGDGGMRNGPRPDRFVFSTRTRRRVLRLLPSGLSRRASRLDPTATVRQPSDQPSSQGARSEEGTLSPYDMLAHRL